FAETAGLISQLDLVISVDTSVAHLAGALGKPVWLLLPFVPDWRWLLDRDDSPWYPTLRLFRQPQRDDWASVFAKIERELRSLLDRELIQSDQRKASSFTITPSGYIPQPAPASATVNLQSALALHRRGQLAEAEEICRNILKVAPDHFDAIHLLGITLLQRGQL